jgi:Lon protease-like protein
MKRQRVIPIFPLPLVLFPGALTPLHIFEPRYRQMLAQVLAGDQTFGILYQAGLGSVDERAGELASQTSETSFAVGCLAEVVLHEPLADGRSNILCQGLERFELLWDVPGEPFRQAEVRLMGDLLPESTREQQELESQISETRSLLKRLLIAWKAGQSASDEDSQPLADMLQNPPTDPEKLSLLVASYLDLAPTLLQRWLELTDTRTRLAEINPHLARLTAQLEDRFRVQQIASTNGHVRRNGTAPRQEGEPGGGKI